jgi:hypothetical protein
VSALKASTSWAAVLLVAASVVAGPAVKAEDQRLRPLQESGTWIDVYDWAPSYTKKPRVTAATMKLIKAADVGTIYVQAARSEHAAPLVDRASLRRMITAARAENLNVVLWYLPSYRPDRDLARITAMQSLRPDGIALDLESRKPPSQKQVLDLLTATRRVVPESTVLMAVVYPPGSSGVTGRTTWSNFPWAKADGLVDAWAVMAYYRESRLHSRDAGAYVRSSVEALRKEIGGEPQIHAIMGVASTAAEVRAVRTSTDALVIGLSIYDWASSTPSAHMALRRR